MKQALVILRGAPASGKTTIAEQLRDFDKKIVWLKTDNFKPFFSNDLDEAIGAVMQTALATLSYLLDQGYSVVFEGIFKDPIYAKRAMQLGETKNIPVITYQLKCSLKTLQERDRTRKGVKEGCRKPLGDELIENLYNMIEEKPIQGAVSLDTESTLLEECIAVIRKNFE